MNKNNQQFELISFWNLLLRHKIEIPIIQRDYAQGRTKNEKVIDAFLKALQAATPSEPVELDFIYGDLHDAKEGDVFRPLDGQQRLTTLFLLHWYAARRSNVLPDVYRPILARFSYQTRISSREFCRRLVAEDFPIQWDDDASKQPSLSIIDCPWFLTAWKRDPTISGILKVLNKIHSISWCNDLWQHLTSEVSPIPISFKFIELRGFGLSDDLYIKMNARGKPLTPFETFKALFEELISKKDWDKEKTIENRFAIKVDTKWTDLFWQLCPANESGLKQIDKPFLNFFAHSLVCSIASGNTAIEKETARVQEILNNAEGLKLEHFTEEFYEDLCRRLDLAANKLDKLKQDCPSNWVYGAKGEVPILQEVTCESGPQYSKRLILHAQLRLLENPDSPPEQRSDWKRVIRNVAENTSIDQPERFIGAIRLIEELAAGCESIYKYLAEEKILSGFASDQVKEEQRKARLITLHPQQKELLHRLEDTRFCRGRIFFALYCADGGMDNNDQKLDFKLLLKVATVIEKYFGEGITDEIRRALFTVDDGKFYQYWGSYFFAKNLPKFCLIENNEDFYAYSHNPGFRHYLKGLVLKLTEQTLQEIIETYKPSDGTPNWRVRLIKDPELIKHATTRYIALDENNHVVYPIPGTRPHDNERTQEYLEKHKIE